jgi:hypothetical protein
MGGYLRTQTSVASGRRPGALLAVLVAAALLMSLPALVASLSILDSNLLRAAHEWAVGLSAWVSDIARARVVLYVPLLVMVARARENP